MPFENQWARIPLSVRWGISLLIAAVAIVALVLFVTHHDDNGLAHVSAKAQAQERRQAVVLIGSDQAPRTAEIGTRSARAALVAGVRAEMRHRIATGNVDGPLQGVRCGQSGHRAGRRAFHCIARAADVNYPFLAVATAGADRVVFCKKDFPPAPSENIPVSRRCRL